MSVVDGICEHCHKWHDPTEGCDMTEDLLTYLKAGWQMVADRYHIHVYAYRAPPGHASRTGYLAFSKLQPNLGPVIEHMFPATAAPVPSHGSITIAGAETGP